MTEYEQSILNRIEQLIFEGKIGNDFLVANIQLCIDYLQLLSISDYAKEVNKSRQYIDKTIDRYKYMKILNTKYIINND